MRSVALVVVAFAAMEPVTAATHRFVMHGVGARLHRSHHRGRHTGFEGNDVFPLAFGALVCLGLWIGFHEPGWRDLVPIGAGITAYGIAYAAVHDVYIHRRLRRLGLPRSAVLDRLAAAHKVHHRTSGPPYGMLLPIVPRRTSASGSRPSHVPADA
jgi:beta-carotene 3-hydroxylase